MIILHIYIHWGNNIMEVDSSPKRIVKIRLLLTPLPLYICMYLYYMYERVKSPCIMRL